MSDSVRDYLRDRGCAQHVVSGGIEGLVENWERTVESIAKGYEFGLDDYLNDLDGRQLISDVMAIDEATHRAARYRERVERADEQMKKVVRLTNVCLWGDAAAAERGWSAKENWWYFSEPKAAGRELLEDLESARKRSAAKKPRAKTDFLRGE